MTTTQRDERTSTMPTDTDDWGRPLMQAGDGHSAWSCNNRECADHDASLYGPVPDSAPVSHNHPTVDLPAQLEGPRLPTTYRPHAEWAREPIPSNRIYDAMRAGHLQRKGHELTGFLVTTGGFAELVRTCCSESATTHAPCPDYPGQWFHKSTGACSCAAGHRS